MEKEDYPEFDDAASFIISQEDFDDGFENTKAWVLDCLKSEPHDSWPPQLTVLCRSPLKGSENEINHFLINGDFNEADEKHALMRALGRTLCDMRKVPLAAYFTAEAWQSTQRTGIPFMEPRYDPMRREVITISGLSPGGKCRAATHLAVERKGGVSEEGSIIPGEFGETLTDCEPRLLESFYQGYFEKPRKVVAESN